MRSLPWAVEPVIRPKATVMLDDVRDGVHRLIAHSSDIEGYTEGSDLLMLLERLAPYVAPIPLSRIADRIEESMIRLQSMADLFPGHGVMRDAILMRAEPLVRLQQELRGGRQERAETLRLPIVAESVQDEGPGGAA